jgi:hypothetical protein
VIAPIGLLLLLAPADAALERHAATASRLLEGALADGGAARYAQQLSDRVGPRLAGSPGEKAAVAWALGELRRLGLEPRAETLMVPVWVRGEESARILAPVEQRLVVTALGGSIPTPPDGVTAEVVEADSFEALRALGAARVRGRIVLWNRPMQPGFAGYSAINKLRGSGASEAARLGAVASLVRSLGSTSQRLPHTGGMRYASDAPKIPAAAVTAEDADLVARLLAAGDSVRVTLRLGCETRPDVPGANVVAELVGRERPDEIVLIGAHLDSWDLGTGAIDDAAGVGIVLESLRLLKAHGLTPRRTLRAVLFANEENGLRGARAYAAEHAHELERHVAAIEADAGAGRPQGLAVHAGPGGAATLARVAGLLPGLGATRIVQQIGGADISVLAPRQVPLVGLLQDDRHYFDWHHTPADTFDKIEPLALAEAAGFFAAVAWVLAEDELVLPRPEPASEQP